MLNFFKRTVLLIAIFLHICATTDENLSQSDSNIAANPKRKIPELYNPSKIKEKAAQKRLRKAAKGTRSILGFLQPVPRSNTAISQNELSLSTNSHTTSQSLSKSAADLPFPEIIVTSSVSIRNRKTKKEDTSEPAVFSIVSSAFFTEKVVRVPFFPEAQNAIAQIICIEENQYWSKFLINSKLKHEVVHCFDDRESAEKWIFDIAKRLKITLEAR